VTLGRVAQAVQADLARVGIRVELIERDASSQREAARAGNADMALLDWWADYPDGDNFLYPLFSSASFGPGGNYAFYSDPVTDSLILAARRTLITGRAPRYTERSTRGKWPRRGCTRFPTPPSAGDHRVGAAGDLQWPALDRGATRPAPVSRFVGRRLLLLVPTLFGVLVAAFLLLNVAPGDPVQGMVGERADSATIARLRAELHLDDPLPVQFWHYLAGVLRGDLGRSYITRRPIAQDLIERFPKTAQLALAAMSFAAVAGITLGVLAAVRPGGVVDRLASLAAYLGVSFPVYWVGLLLIPLPRRVGLAGQVGWAGGPGFPADARCGRWRCSRA
jgi:hypothetical protein